MEEEELELSVERTEWAGRGSAQHGRNGRSGLLRLPKTGRCHLSLIHPGSERNGQDGKEHNFSRLNLETANLNPKALFMNLEGFRGVGISPDDSRINPR